MASAKRTWLPRSIESGDVALASSDKTKEDTAQVGLVRDAIDKYRLALQKDPYNADATLKLAVAYDKVLHKGCALAMLKRLASLASNPKFANETNRALGAIDGQRRAGSRAIAKTRSTPRASPSV